MVSKLFLYLIFPYYRLPTGSHVMCRSPAKHCTLVHTSADGLKLKHCQTQWRDKANQSEPIFLKYLPNLSGFLSFCLSFPHSIWLSLSHL